MSRLDELIKELCPNGVEYKELGEIAKVTIGEFVHKDKQSENAEYPVFNGGISNTGYYNDYNEEKDKIIMSARGANAGYINRVFVNYWAGNSCYTINTNDEIMNWNFLYYVLKNKEKNILSKQQTASIPSISKKQVEGILVPVPPLEVQEEIVRILDDYTKSVEELKEKLNKELIARKKQYSWYRDYLLKFENKVEIVKLGSIVEVYDGTHQTPDYKTSGIPFVSVENINSIYSTEKYVSEEDFEKNYKIKPRIDDVFMTRIGTVGKCAIVTKNIPLAYYVSLALLRPNKNKIDARYLKYIIESGVGRKELNKRILFTAVPIKINKGDIDKIEIPLPPLEVQKRIVEVLDNFEKICKELNIELSSEIEVKQKEYEFVKNYLLTFEEKLRQAILACELASLRSKQQAQNLIKILQYVYGYVEVRLGDIGSIVRGNGLQKRDFTEEGVGCIHYGQIYTKYGMATEKTISFVEESLAEKLRKVEKGNIIFAVTSENIEDLCKCVVWLGEEEIVTGGHTAILKHNQNSKFLAYYFQTEAFHSQKRKLATGTKVMDITATKLEEILIPLPSLEEQQRIVDILDRFDRLCNDISEGLPAEIEARQKQYEYYREKLLSFKKL